MKGYEEGDANLPSPRRGGDSYSTSSLRWGQVSQGKSRLWGVGSDGGPQGGRRALMATGHSSCPGK